MTKKILTREYLLDRLTYEPESGIFTHNHNFGSRYRVGDRADTPGHAALKGYRLVNLLNQKFLAHRVAWLYVHGVMPTLSIDHIDGDRGNNRLSNLREVKHQTNIQNQVRPHKRSTTGFLGVVEYKGKFISRVTNNYRHVYVGTYATAELAYAAYLEAKRKLHAGCTL